MGALTYVLHTIMPNNIFIFGDTYWLQTAGTAMGTPPAPNYATLYYAIHEMEIIPKYPEIEYYSQIINNGFALWTPNHDNINRDKERFQSFTAGINAFGTGHSFFENNEKQHLLEWEFEKRSRKKQSTST